MRGGVIRFEANRGNVLQQSLIGFAQLAKHDAEIIAGERVPGC